MRAFTPMTAVAIPLLRDNIDTDAIVPSREIRSVSKAGLGQGLFAGWRYRSVEERIADPTFVLNDPAYRGAQILLTGENFGCGSSREHAVWALAEYGFRVLLAPSFNPIFFRNCVRNGLLPAKLPGPSVFAVAGRVALNPRLQQLSVDLAQQSICMPDGGRWQFDIAAEAKDVLLLGLDAIDQTWQLREQIEAFRAEDRRKRPWVYG